MRILIFTSADHLYANVLLKKIIESGILDDDTVLVCEQDWIIPKKSTFEGLKQYIQTSGLLYVFLQALKVYLFKWKRKTTKQHSPFYPYTKLPHKKITSRILQDFSKEETKEGIRAFKPDIILSLLSKEIMPRDILDIPQLGCINLHPAYLPTYRGISPTFWVLAEGKPFIGCTLHTIDSSIDTGSILLQEKIETKGYKTEHALYLQCMDTGSKLVITYLQQLKKGNPPQGSPQQGEGCYRSLPTKKAISVFFKRGYKFFSLSEFV